MKRAGKLFPKQIDELQKLPTKRLLALLKRLHQCEESFELSDREGVFENDENSIVFKNSPQWQNEYEKIKKILAEREHISRKKI